MAPEAAQIERHLGEFFAAHEGVPGWMTFVREWAVARLQSERGYVNSAILIRLREDVEPCLDELLSTFRAAGCGAGFWLTSQTVPGNLAALLKPHGFRLRRKFPAMFRNLKSRVPRVSTDAWEIEPWNAPGVPSSSKCLAALHRGKRLGSCVISIGGECAGLHDVVVDPRHRNRGIGTSLVLAASALAQEAGSPGIGLIASGLGESVYERCGFHEVARFDYWYSALTR